ERGLDGATMREIAAEAGFANGALKPYFPTKDRLLDFAFEHIFSQTNRRMEAATAGLSGLRALRAYCHEILPLDDERLSEARVAISFWQKALRDPAKAAVHERSMAQWREVLAELLRDAGLPDHADPDAAVGAIMDLVLGAQITATLSPAHHTAQKLVDPLDCRLGALVEGSAA
ncbi:MAG: TetR family transcriptional regulator, partial [Sinomonas sp.]|nr:TetR family transcriptional regulator [Sinomonas sp.]